MTYRLPSLNSLRAFEAAARHLSFRAAADETGVTSGAISQQVRKLELSLGVTLFHRLPHGLLLTAEGATYLPKITKIFDDLTAATEEIAPDMNGRKFSVGICPNAARMLPKSWPQGVEGLEPYVRERVETSEVDRVRSGEIDCLVKLGNDEAKHLEAIGIPQGFSSNKSDHALNLICKPGLANCKQTAELISSLAALSLVQGE